MKLAVCLTILCLTLLPAFGLRAQDFLEVGYAETDITPEIVEWQDADGNGQYTYGNGQPYDTGEKVTCFKDGDIYIGNGNGKAEYVHHPIAARVMVIVDPQTGKKVALVSLDLYMMEKPDIDFIRNLLANMAFTHIAIHCTHSHMGPDTLGRNGPDVFTNGINGIWLRKMQYATAAAVRNAFENRTVARLRFLKTATRFGLNDTRDPLVYDDDLMAMQAVETGSGKTLVTLVQWTNHPECTLSVAKEPAPPEMKDKEGHIITDDFPGQVARHAAKVFGGHGLYFNGSVGGLMTMLHTFVWEPFQPYSPDTPAEQIPSDYPGKIHDNFKMAELIGNELVDKLYREGLQNQAFAGNLFVDAKSVPVRVKLDNLLFKVAFAAGIIGFDKRQIDGHLLDKPYLITEVSRIDIGPAQIACVPGEITSEMCIGLPEDFYTNSGKYFRNPEQHTAAANFTVPGVIKHKMTGQYKFVFGLTNDALGYMVAPCDFKLDDKLPWIEHPSGHYEETNSVGSEIAPKVLEGFGQLFE